MLNACTFCIEFGLLLHNVCDGIVTPTFVCAPVHKLQRHSAHRRECTSCGCIYESKFCWLPNLLVLVSSVHLHVSDVSKELDPFGMYTFDDADDRSRVLPVETE